MLVISSFRETKGHETIFFSQSVFMELMHCTIGVTSSKGNYHLPLLLMVSTNDLPNHQWISIVNWQICQPLFELNMFKFLALLLKSVAWVRQRFSVTRTRNLSMFSSNNYDWYCRILSTQNAILLCRAQAFFSNTFLFIFTNFSLSVLKPLYCYTSRCRCMTDGGNLSFGH